jgi:hypothetical protein
MSCAKPQDTPVDLSQAKTEVTALMDQVHSSMKSKDLEGLKSLLAEDGLYCGTDPSELFDKKAFLDLVSQEFADTSRMINDYPITKREIKVHDGGKGANIVDQFTMTVISPTIPLRLTAHAVNSEGKWLLDLISLSLIPPNEDLHNVSAAVK